MVAKARRKTGRSRALGVGAGTLVLGKISDRERGDSNIAERIIRVARPFVEEIGPCDDYDRVVRSVFGFAVAAWNAVLLPEKQKADLLATVTTVPGLTVAELEELRVKVDDMVTRRMTLYPDDRRYVDNYRFSGEGAELRFEARVLAE